MNPEKLAELAERLERTAIADAENAVGNTLYAERAHLKFSIAASLRSLSGKRSSTDGEGAR